MPNEKQIERRVHACWQVRACAAGLCAGAQIFLAGCAVGMPLTLGSAWISSLAPLGFAVWIALCCRRGLDAQVRPARAWLVLLALTLLSSGAFALSSLVSFAAQTLVEQASPVWIQAAALIAVALCALSGGTGSARLCFALRYALPVLLLGLSMAAMPLRVPVGLFPILGAGAAQTGKAALAMLFGAAPVLMLLLPPSELSQAGEAAQRCNVPQAKFFCLRVLLGALAGVFLLFLTCVCSTYESIAESSEWGARLRMAAGNQAHEGVMQMLLMLAKLLAMQLLAVNMVCTAEQALTMAFPMLSGMRAGLWLLLALAGGILAARALFGDLPLLAGAPVIAVPAVLLAAFAGRGRRA